MLEAIRSAKVAQLILSTVSTLASVVLFFASAAVKAIRLAGCALRGRTAAAGSERG